MPSLEAHADRRWVGRQVVFCLVDLWSVLGEALERHLVPLAPSQRRLVAIYVERAAQKASAAA